MKAPLKSKRSKVIAAIAVVAIGGGAAVYWFGLRPASASAAETPESTTSTVTASLETLEKTVSASGTLAPTVDETVSFEATGTVLTVDVAAGDTVKKGQQLATIDTLQSNADLLSAKSDLAQAQAQLADLEDADDGSDTDAARIEAASAQVDLAESKVSDAEATLAATTLVAPVAGQVTTVGIAVGDKVTGTSSSSSSGGSSPDGGSTSTSQFEIMGADSWEVSTTVEDSEISDISVGDQAELTVDGVDDTVYGVVDSIGLVSTASSGSATFPVVIAVTGSPTGLHDGVSATVAIVYERRLDVLTVPSDAVRQASDGTSVVDKVNDDGSVTETTVEVGETSGTLTEITSGLSEGDRVQVTIVTSTSTSGSSSTDQQQFQMPDGMQLPDGFTPGDMPSGGNFPGGGQMPGGQGGN